MLPSGLLVRRLDNERRIGYWPSYSTRRNFGPPAVFARDLSGGEERQMLPDVYNRNFFPTADGIYYLGLQTDDGFFPLEFYQFSSKTSRLLTKIGGQADQGCAEVRCTRDIGRASHPAATKRDAVRELQNEGQHSPGRKQRTTSSRADAELAIATRAGWERCPR